MKLKIQYYTCWGKQTAQQLLGLSGVAFLSCWNSITINLAVFDRSLFPSPLKWGDSPNSSLSPEQTALTNYLFFPLCVSVLGNLIKNVCAMGQAQTQADWTTRTSPSGLVTAKICMTSHSAEDKAHCFLPDRVVGGGSKSKAWTLLLQWAYICVCTNCAATVYTCESAAGYSNARVLYGWCSVRVLTRVHNVNAHAIKPCLSGQ